jgi:putative ABC transport system permease protein
MPNLSDRLYWVLLHAYPSEFRDEYGPQLRQVFRDRLRRPGQGGVIRLWAHTLADLAVTAPAEHFDAFQQDVHSALRFFFSNPGFTAVAVMCLGLGIGANTAIFSLLNGLLFGQLPVGQPEQLFTVVRGRLSDAPPVSYPDYLDFQKQTQSFSDLSLTSDTYIVKLGAGAQTEQIACQLVSGNYFQVLRLNAALGRMLQPDEPVIVLSDGLWKRRFGGDPGILGRTVAVNGVQLTVIGVAPESFHGDMVPLETAAWMPIDLLPQILPDDAPMLSRNARCCGMHGRLKPGVTRLQAETELQAVDQQLWQAYPRTNASSVRPEDRILRVTKMEGVVVMFLRKQVITVGGFMMAVVALVLLISCANVANLLLARVAARRQEMAIRLAMGARRGRLIRQLLTESTLLALMGAAAALLIAAWAPHAIAGLVPVTGYGSSFAIQGDIDRRVLAFAALLAALTGVLFGLAPALEASRADLVSMLKEGRASGATGRRFGLRGLLVVGQIAVSFVLLIGAGLFLRSLAKTQSVDPGFNTTNTFFLGVDLDEKQWPHVRRIAFLDELREGIQSVAGVESATVANHVPLDRSGQFHSIRIIPQGHEADRITFEAVAPRYFATLGIPLLNGRVLDDTDRANSPAAAVINATMARQYWPGENVIGKQIRMNDRGLSVVGVVGDGKYGALGEDPRPCMYIPLSQSGPDSSTSRVKLIVRTAADPKQMIAPVVAQIQTINPNLPILRIKTMAEHLRDGLRSERATTTLFGVFGFLALGLASVGIYGVISHTVAQRTHEIGIRMAMGARRLDVLRMVLRQSMVLASVGIAIGAPLALAQAYLLKGLLYGVGAADPVTFLGIAILWFTIALIATWIPARRAARVDPLIALRVG